MVVCNCEKCNNLEEPQFYPLEALKNLISLNKKIKQCDKSGIDVPIASLIGAVYPPDKIEEKLMGKEKAEEKMKPENLPKTKFLNSLVALFTISIPLILITAIIVLFNNLKIDMWWFLALIIFILLLIPSIWTISVSPESISEKGALKSFDNILRKMNILSILSGSLDKYFIKNENKD